MNVNAAIIDQRLSSISDDIRELASDELRITDDNKLKSLSFVYLVVKTALDLSHEDTFDCLTEGGGDFGVDALHISEVQDGEFSVSLFQGKYKRKLDGDAHFPANGIEKLINAIRHLFDPASTIDNIRPRLQAKVEEIRSLIRDGYLPLIRAIACNNGIKWPVAAQEAIDNEALGEQVSWEHINHDQLLKILQATKPVDDTLQLKGQAVVEDFNFTRILVGRISVAEVSALIARHGQRLLERNIRRYLGLHGNRVNEAIKNTLKSDEPSNFYFYNNGITMTCEKFSHNALQSGNFKVITQNLQIINGGQTCVTISKTLSELPNNSKAFNEADVLLRLYELPKDNEDLVQSITFATNSQNPVDLRDLRANDERQIRLETDIHQLGYEYRRKRTDSSTRPTDITSGVAAEAILSVWRKRPQQAKYFSREHFGKLYDKIFTKDLNGSQAIIATLLYRFAENRRKRPSDSDQNFVRYASCFLAMQMGRHLLTDLGCQSCAQLTHENFNQARGLVKEKAEDYFSSAKDEIATALTKLYGDREVSLQQLSATFRRGDLISKLEPTQQ